MGINDRLEKIEKILEEKGKEKKKKKFNLPWKAKVGNKKMGEGYATILEIQENKHADFRKEKITDGTIHLDDTFHAINPKDIFFYKGKPLIIQCKNKLNPYNPLEDKHETYGQKYVMARMEGDKLTLKKKLGLGLGIGMIIIIAIIGYSVLFGA
jgi:hypothetical protein